MRGNDEKVVEIEIERLHDFKNHPFKVQADSPKQIQRYLKLNDLIPKLLDKVDDETMGFTIGVELAYLRKTNQEIVLEAMENTLATPNLSQAIRIKKMQEEEKISVDSKVIIST